MQLKLPFRLARGVAVALAIVSAHLVIAWLFNNLRIPKPDLGPVFATLLGDPDAAPDSSARAQDAPPLAPKRSSAPPPVQVLSEVPQQRPR
jgi:hypothetical protein